MRRFRRVWRKAITWWCVGFALAVVGLAMTFAGMFLIVSRSGLAGLLMGFGYTVVLLGVVSIGRAARMSDVPPNGLEA